MVEFVKYTTLCEHDFRFTFVIANSKRLSDELPIRSYAPIATIFKIIHLICYRAAAIVLSDDDDGGGLIMNALNIPQEMNLHCNHGPLVTTPMKNVLLSITTLMQKWCSVSAVMHKVGHGRKVHIFVDYLQFNHSIVIVAAPHNTPWTYSRWQIIATKLKTLASQM